MSEPPSPYNSVPAVLKASSLKEELHHWILQRRRDAGLPDIVRLKDVPPHYQLTTDDMDRRERRREQNRRAAKKCRAKKKSEDERTREAYQTAITENELLKADNKILQQRLHALEKIVQDHSNSADCRLQKTMSSGRDESPQLFTEVQVSSFDYRKLELDDSQSEDSLLSLKAPNQVEQDSYIPVILPGWQQLKQRVCFLEADQAATAAPSVSVSAQPSFLAGPLPCSSLLPSAARDLKVDPEPQTLEEDAEDHTLQVGLEELVPEMVSQEPPPACMIPLPGLHKISNHQLGIVSLCRHEVSRTVPDPGMKGSGATKFQQKETVTGEDLFLEMANQEISAPAVVERAAGLSQSCWSTLEYPAYNATVILSPKSTQSCRPTSSLTPPSSCLHSVTCRSLLQSPYSSSTHTMIPHHTASSSSLSSCCKSLQISPFSSSFQSLQIPPSSSSSYRSLVTTCGERQVLYDAGVFVPASSVSQTLQAEDFVYQQNFLTDYALPENSSLTLMEDPVM